MADDDKILSFGIDAMSGRPLKQPTDADFLDMIGVAQEPPRDLDEALKARAAAVTEDVAPAGGGRAFGVVPGEGASGPNDLGQTGWGILYGPSVDKKIKNALEPLIEHRRKQKATPFEIYDEDGLRPGEDVYAWLKRRKVRLDQVDPEAGVPYYLMIVASPQDISFEFQYTLDLYWACGRLWFDTPEEFGRYAESVVKYETTKKAPTSRQVALFAPEHDFDDATQLFTRQVAEPLCGRQGAKAPLGKGLNYKLQEFLGKNATKKNLAKILKGGLAGGTPALLFSGGHGMQFPNADPLQLATQGALVCQDWEGYGEITADHWFAAKDVPADAKVHGMIHFMFACHGGGVPQFDNFDRLSKKPAEIAPQAFFSKLPQALLAHKNGGALCVLAHMERAWAYSFQGDGGIAQNQGFLSVLRQLLRGDRIGNATDAFNVNWAAISTRLAEEQLTFSKKKNQPVAPVRKLWIQRDDARNFMVFGDPAVQLREADLK
jgi:Peptidase family C25